MVNDRIGITLGVVVGMIVMVFYHIITVGGLVTSESGGEALHNLAENATLIDKVAMATSFFVFIGLVLLVFMIAVIMLNVVSVLKDLAKSSGIKLNKKRFILWLCWGAVVGGIVTHAIFVIVETPLLMLLYS